MRTNSKEDNVANADKTNVVSTSPITVGYTIKVMRTDHNDFPWLFSLYYIELENGRDAADEGTPINWWLLPEIPVWNDLYDRINYNVRHSPLALNLAKKALLLIGVVVGQDAAICSETGNYRLFIFPPLGDKPEWSMKLLWHKEGEYFFNEMLPLDAQRIQTSPFTRRVVETLLRKSRIPNETITTLLDQIEKNNPDAFHRVSLKA